MKRCVFKLLSFLFLALLTVGLVQLHQKFMHTAVGPRSANMTPVDKTCTSCKSTRLDTVTAHKKNTSYNCKGCSKLLDKVLKDYSLKWTKNEGNHQQLRYLLITNCNGFQKAAVTQINTPLGTSIAYDGENRNRTVTEDLFNSFPKDAPFSDKVLDTCAVVGNGGILANSSCGEAIDSAQAVIRCNLAPLEKWHKDVGKKTSLVTANPSIFWKYSSLNGRRRAFVDTISVYGDSLIFLPAFAFSRATEISLKVYFTLEDFSSPGKTIFMNPDYTRDLYGFWRSQGLDPGQRLSTGFMMVSLALEICNNVDVYGFWPFYNHPYGFQPLMQHYYDDVRGAHYHRMPVEFDYLVKLHNQGVLKLHLGEC